MSFRPIVCVDLDHTLIQADLTEQACWRFISQKSFRGVYDLVGWMLKGMFSSAGWVATLKVNLAQHQSIDPESLPYDPMVLDELHHWKNQGHHMVLATGAPLIWAQQVNQYLKLFDDVWGTQDCNLVGVQKVQTLIKYYGEKQFMYYGDSKVDLKVWPHAHSGVAVNPRPHVRQGLKRLTQVPMRILETSSVS